MPLPTMAALMVITVSARMYMDTPIAASMVMDQGLSGPAHLTTTNIESSPAHCGCKSNITQTLAKMGVRMMLAGNMGQGAVNVLNSCGIDVLRGCAGEVKEVAENWLAGNLKDSGIACDLHVYECHES